MHRLMQRFVCGGNKKFDVRDVMHAQLLVAVKVVHITMYVHV